MFKKIMNKVLLVFILCVSQDLFAAAVRLAPRDGVRWTERENELVEHIDALFNAAFKGDLFSKPGAIFDPEIDEAVEYVPPYQIIDEGGRLVELSLEPYPQALVGAAYESSTPSEALEKFATVNDRVGDAKRRVDGSQALRFQSHASRSPKPLCPFLIKLKIRGWMSVQSLRFLKHPTLLALDWFQKCLGSLEVAECGIKKFSAKYLNGYENCVALDVHDNLITEIVVAGAEENVLHCIESLDLSNNRISALGDVFQASWGRLQRLDLAENSISSLLENSFKGLNLLYELDLASNLLNSDGIHVRAFATVGTAAPHFNLRINLADNRLTNFPPLPVDVASKLVELNLDANPIREVNGVDGRVFHVLRYLSIVCPERTSEQNRDLKPLVAKLFPLCSKVIVENLGLNDGYRTP